MDGHGIAGEKVAVYVYDSGLCEGCVKAVSGKALDRLSARSRAIDSDPTG
jgi:hypothetical protein